jgi:hypothetical protein
MKAYILPLLFLVAIAGASAIDEPVMVNGHVYYQGTSNPVPDVEVTITCPMGDGGWTLTDTTNAQGYYVVEFGAEQCEVGDSVEICAGTDNCEQAIVPDTDMPYINKDIVYVNLEIPEFAWAGAGVALIGAGLGFMLLRKKN